MPKPSRITLASVAALLTVVSPIALITPTASAMQAPGILNGVLNTATQSGVLNRTVDAATNAATNAGPIATAPRQNGVLGGVFGCDASGSTQRIGAIGGGIVGGLVGSRINKTIGTIAGGALGAAAGSWIGCKLQRSSQTRAQRAAERAAATGQGQSWSDPETGASGTSSVLGTNGTSLSGLRLAKGVTPLSDYMQGGQTATAAKAVIIRSAPSASSTNLGSLRAGEAAIVSATTRDGAWSLVSQNGVGRGYVSSPLLRSTATASTGCKKVQQTFDVGGRTETDTMNACPDGSGGWLFSRT